jgi:hypothetical protein
MRFAYYARLSPPRQQVYRKSDAIATLALPEGVAAGACVADIRAGLGAEDRQAVARASQELIDRLTRGFRVPPIRVRVLSVRPSSDYSDLHGLYEPDEGSTPARITVWMRTAARRQVVAFKTFVRTLVHEVCHHLDYELFGLPETFHTEGFYKRESMLSAALLKQANERGERAPSLPSRRRAP